ncbi:hypothetical protein CsSME_00027472 [Camellia sinensis var. sinensis]
MTELGHISRDWKLVVIRKKAPTAAAHKDEKTVNAARRADAEIKTIRKANAASNKAASSSTTLNTRKLDDETERLRLIINEKPQIIQEYESGKAIPNQQIITELGRALGAKLP